MLPNIGLGELGLIFLVVLIVMGPKRLPEVARALGKAYRTFQIETRKAQALLKEGFEEVERATKDVRAPFTSEPPTPAAEAPLPPASPAPVAEAPLPLASPAISQPAGVIDVPDEIRRTEDT